MDGLRRTNISASSRPGVFSSKLYDSGTDAESFTMILLILEHDLSFVIARIPRARPSSRNAAGHKNEILGRKMLENSVEFCSRNSAAFPDPRGPLSPHNKRKPSSLYILNDSRANRMEGS